MCVETGPVASLCLWLCLLFSAVPICVCVFVRVCRAGASGSSSARTFPGLRAPGQRATQVSTSKRSPPIMSLLCVFVYVSSIHVFMFKPGQRATQVSTSKRSPLSKGPPLSSSLCVRLTACVWSSRPSISPYRRHLGMA